MSKHAPMHFIEISFYSTASFLALFGLTWFFFGEVCRLRRTAINSFQPRLTSASKTN